MAELRFRSRQLWALHEREDRSRLDPRYVRRIELILALLDRVDGVEELRVPGFRLHQLSGNLAGLRSIRVSANWRIVFRADGATTDEIDYVDYHER